MFSKTNDRDQYLLAALFLLGLLAIGATYLSSDVIATRVIDAATEDTGQHWSNVVGEEVARAGRIDPDTLGWRLSHEIREGLNFAPISAVTIYDAAGAEIVSSNPDLGMGLRASVTENTADTGSLAAALAGEFGVIGRHADIDGQDHRFADIYAPVDLGAEGVGAVVVTVDQTAPASIFSAAFETVTSLTAFILWIAFMVPTFIAWRRIEDRRKASTEIQYLAHHDALTELPNRVQFNDRLAEALDRSSRHGKKVAVLCLDLDRFKDVNDTLGHPVGDALLCTVANRLRTAVREIDVIGRLGGDEFAVVAEDLDEMEDTIPLAQRLCEALVEPVQINGHDIATSTSIGIAIFPDDGATSEEILKNADLALYRAKGDGRNTFRFFEPEMDAALQKRRRLEHDMRQALQLEQFQLHYQPQYDLTTNELAGYEALLRWVHPEDGPVSPANFIPVAEESGLIIQIGQWVLQRACEDAASWTGDARIAVNLSPAQFRNHDIVGTVRNALASTGLDPARLELEITEGLLMRNTDTTLSVLNELRALGVSIAMDDFGTGYSSLSYLSRFPFDKIKIDRTFIDNLHRDRDANAIVNTIVSLGHSLNMTITAEGVETSEQADFLRSCGCTQVQGFLYGMPATEGGKEVLPHGPDHDELFAEAEARAGMWADQLREMAAKGKPELDFDLGLPGESDGEIDPESGRKTIRVA